MLSSIVGSWLIQGLVTNGLSSIIETWVTDRIETHDPNHHILNLTIQTSQSAIEAVSEFYRRDPDGGNNRRQMMLILDEHQKPLPRDLCIEASKALVYEHPERLVDIVAMSLLALSLDQETIVLIAGNWRDQWRERIKLDQNRKAFRAFQRDLLHEIYKEQGTTIEMIQDLTNSVGAIHGFMEERLAGFIWADEPDNSNFLASPGSIAFMTGAVSVQANRADKYETLLLAHAGRILALYPEWIRTMTESRWIALYAELLQLPFEYLQPVIRACIESWRRDLPVDTLGRMALTLSRLEPTTTLRFLREFIEDQHAPVNAVSKPNIELMAQLCELRSQTFVQSTLDDREWTRLRGLTNGLMSTLEEMNALSYGSGWAWYDDLHDCGILQCRQLMMRPADNFETVGQTREAMAEARLESLRNTLRNATERVVLDRPRIPSQSLSGNSLINITREYLEYTRARLTIWEIELRSYRKKHLNAPERFLADLQRMTGVKQAINQIQWLEALAGRLTYDLHLIAVRRASITIEASLIYGDRTALNDASKLVADHLPHLLRIATETYVTMPEVHYMCEYWLHQGYFALALANFMEPSPPVKSIINHLQNAEEKCDHTLAANERLVDYYVRRGNTQAAANQQNYNGATTERRARYSTLLRRITSGENIHKDALLAILKDEGWWDTYE